MIRFRLDCNCNCKFEIYKWIIMNQWINAVSDLTGLCHSVIATKIDTRLHSMVHDSWPPAKLQDNVAKTIFGWQPRIVFARFAELNRIHDCRMHQLGKSQFHAQVRHLCIRCSAQAALHYCVESFCAPLGDTYLRYDWLIGGQWAGGIWL